MYLEHLELEHLTVEDEASFRHVALYGDLKGVAGRARLPFAVAPAGSPLAHWDAALLLNHTQWDAAAAVEVLCEPLIPADALCHRSWHHVCAVGLGAAATTPHGLLLAEAIASAFDAYLVGRLIGHAPDSTFLETQVASMRETAEAAGTSAADFERLLGALSADPDGSFERLRALLFDVATGLLASDGLEAAAGVLTLAAGADMAPLLFHYELANWVLFARAGRASESTDAAAREVDGCLRRAPCSLDWLEKNWVAPLLTRP